MKTNQSWCKKILGHPAWAFGKSLEEWRWRPLLPW